MWLWGLAILTGLALAVLASRKAVEHLTLLAAGSSIPPFFFGITLVAIGTDLPEIANSIVASISGHGDLNIGDSIGSAATQMTLVLGLLPLLAGGFLIKRGQVALIGGMTILSIGVGIALLADGEFSRSDAVILLLVWIMASAALWRQGSLEAPELSSEKSKRFTHGALAMFYLALVAAGATLSIRAFVEVSIMFSIPQYLISFFAASLGTSLPELFVDLTAIRKGHSQMAIGDIFGSSLVDVTLSIAIGPLLFPSAVTASLAIRGSIIAAVAILLATALLLFAGRHNKKNGIILICMYLTIYPLLIL